MSVRAARPAAAAGAASVRAAGVGRPRPGTEKEKVSNPQYSILSLENLSANALLRASNNKDECIKKLEQREYPNCIIKVVKYSALFQTFQEILQKEPDPNVKFEIAESCGNFNDPRALNILELLQKDPNPYVKRAVAESCGKINEVVVQNCKKGKKLS